MDVKIEIKEEPWWENETTELRHETEITFEFVPVLNVNKKESVCDLNGEEELSTLESPRLTTDHDGSGICTSWSHSNSHCEVDDFTSDFETTSKCIVLRKNQNKESTTKQNIFIFKCAPIHECQPGSELNILQDEEKNLLNPEQDLHRQFLLKEVCNKDKLQQNYESSEKNFIDSSQHILYHSESNLYRCDFCEKTFKQKSHLSSHILRHSETKAYKCDTCKKSFKQKSDLKRHSFCHSDVKPYKCESCEKSFSCSSDLKKHTLCHLGLKPYKCDSCDKCFRRKSYLTRHILCHSGTKPYKCDICDKSFNDKSNLVRHTLSHSGTKPYKCDKCERSFSHNSDLKKHILCHSGIKPYKCDTCQKHFKRKSYLTRHALAHSDIKRPSKCCDPICEVAYREPKVCHLSPV